MQRERPYAEKEFPEPRLPAHPVLSSRALFRRRGTALPSVVDCPHVITRTSARFALTAALEDRAIGAGDSVLLPAYHCTAMVDPVVDRGATPEFFRIRPDTTPDLADLESKLHDRVRAIVLVHYFGFVQDLAGVRALCGDRDVALIEDCAHAYFGARDDQPVGCQGDYAIASTWKFLPVRDGGILASTRHALDGLAGRGPGAVFGAKSLLNGLESAWRFGRLPLSRLVLSPLLWIKNRAWASLKRRNAGSASGVTSQQAALGSPVFESRWIGVKSSLVSRFVAALARADAVDSRRRANYARIADAVGELPGARLLYPDLPSGVVPYVVPVRVEDALPAFVRLRMAGVPVIRFGEELWPGMPEGTCEVAEDYSDRVLQFPCHQELRDGEIEWLISRIRDALSQAESEKGDLPR